MRGHRGLQEEGVGARDVGVELRTTMSDGKSRRRTQGEGHMSGR